MHQFSFTKFTMIPAVSALVVVPGLLVDQPIKDPDLESIPVVGLMASTSAPCATCGSPGRRPAPARRRPAGVRIAVENKADLIHPGQFTEAEITTGTGSLKLAIPSDAITLIKGEPAVFKLEGGNEFHAVIVETAKTIGDWTVIRSGLKEGDEIAVEGVFHLKSLLLKSSIGDEH